MPRDQLGAAAAAAGSAEALLLLPSSLQYHIDNSTAPVPRPFNALRSLPEDMLFTAPEPVLPTAAAPPGLIPSSADLWASSRPQSSGQPLSAQPQAELSSLTALHAAGAVPPRGLRRRSAEALLTVGGGGGALCGEETEGGGGSPGGSGVDHVRWSVPVADLLAEGAAAAPRSPFCLASNSCNPIIVLGSGGGGGGGAAAAPATSPSLPGPAALAPAPCSDAPSPYTPSPSPSTAAPKPRLTPTSPNPQRRNSQAPLSAFERLLKAVSNSDVHSHGLAVQHSSSNSNVVPPHLNSNSTSDAAAASKPRSTGSLNSLVNHRGHIAALLDAAAAGAALPLRPVVAAAAAPPPLAEAAPLRACCHQGQRRSSSVAEYSTILPGGRLNRKAKPCERCCLGPKTATAQLRVELPEERKARTSPTEHSTSPQYTSYSLSMGNGGSSRRQVQVGSACEAYGRSSANRGAAANVFDMLPDLLQRCSPPEPVAQHREPSMGMVKLMKHVRELRLEVEAYRQQNLSLKAALKLEGDARGELTAARQQLVAAHQQLQGMEQREAQRVTSTGCFGFWTSSKPKQPSTQS